MKMLKKLGLLALGTVALAPAAFASGGGGLDYSSLTDQVSFDEVGPAVLTAAGALVGIYVVIRGIKFIMGFVRS